MAKSRFRDLTALCGVACLLLFPSCNIDGSGAEDTPGTTDTTDFPINHLVSDEGTYLPYFSLDSVDFDFDGDTDLMASAWGDYPVLWYENDGTGNFSKHFLNDATKRPSTNRYGDLDGDGDMDFAGLFVGFSSSYFEWYQNDGNNVFTAKPFPLSYYIPEDFGIAHIASSLRYDVVCNDDSTDGLLWLQMGTDGEYITTLKSVGDPGLTGGQAICTADLDGDNEMDIVSSELETEPFYTITWWEKDFKNNFTRNDVATGVVSPRLWTANMDDDAYTDIVVQSENTLYWIDFDGSDVFAEKPIFDALTGFFPYVLDYENDGDIDFFCYLDTENDSDNNTYDEHELLLLENDGIGNFTETVLLSNLERSYISPGDFNGDGYQDLFVFNNLDYLMSWYQFRE